jgi:hypothetical protein
METFKGTSGFHFSGTSLNKLGASEYTLFGLGADTSGSLEGFDQEITGCIKTTLEGCQKSPRVDNLLARVVTFATILQELHGFRPLADCHLAAYDGVIKTGGSTCLYDTSASLIDSVAAYGKQLMDQDYTANGIVCIITDGHDECSKLTAGAVKDALLRARQQECLESMIAILIGVNVKNPSIGKYLRNFKDEAGFSQYLEVQDASPKTFARIAGFISKSVSSQSQSLGSGAGSQPIIF